MSRYTFLCFSSQSIYYLAYKEDILGNGRETRKEESQSLDDLVEWGSLSTGGHPATSRLLCERKINVQLERAMLFFLSLCYRNLSYPLTKKKGFHVRGTEYNKCMEEESGIQGTSDHIMKCIDMLNEAGKVDGSHITKEVEC